MPIMPEGTFWPPVHMIRLTETQSITPYKWVYQTKSARGDGAKLPSLLRQLPLDISVHRFGKRALHADREVVLVERIALEHAQAAPAGADRRRVQILIDGALGDRDGLRISPRDQEPQEALAFGQAGHGISAFSLAAISASAA